MATELSEEGCDWGIAAGGQIPSEHNYIWRKFTPPPPSPENGRGLSHGDGAGMTVWEEG